MGQRPGVPNNTYQAALIKFFLPVVVIAIVVVGWLIYPKLVPPSSGPGPSRTKVVQTTRSTSLPVDSNGLGMSEGGYAFDTSLPRSDGALKQQAAEAFKKGDTTTAQSLWQQAHNIDTNDAEPLIYQEDLRIKTSSYITLVVATMLTGNDASAITGGRNDLQGAYILQTTYNQGFRLGGGKLLRIVIANSGSNKNDADTIAKQIVAAAKVDKTIVGVMGWPFSGQTLSAVKTLTDNHIPMVSPTASTDDLTNKSPFFFRVCPPNQEQAIDGARYAKNRLQAQRVVVFVDPNVSYSKSLANGFSQEFEAHEGNIVATEQYKRGDSASFPDLLQKALTFNPDVIYFAGYADDMGVVLTDLQVDDPKLTIMGGDALYQVGAYPQSAHANYKKLRFTAFAFPDEWGILGQSNPSFFETYSRIFDPNTTHPGTYDYSRPENDAIMAYDATLALAQASHNVLQDGKTELTPDRLQQSLQGLNGDNAVQGISGQIAFGPDGNPQNKAVVILSVNAQGQTQLAHNDIVGCFFIGQTCP